MNPHVHAKNSVKRYGGKNEDYIDLHSFMDSSKGVVADMRHRILTHTGFFAENVIPRVFGLVAFNSEGKSYTPKQVAYDHIEEDFRGMIPPTSDWFINLPFDPWMDNGKVIPPGCQQPAKIFRKKPEDAQKG